MVHDCRQTRDLLDSYLCGELLVETNHAMLEHLAGCPACAGELERRQRVIALLRQAHHAPVDVTALQHRIDHAITVDARSLVARPFRIASLASLSLVATTILAIALTIWLVSSRTTVDAAAYRDSVADHVECALTLPPALVYDAARVARRLPPQFSGLAARLLDPIGAYRLIDAHPCPYKDRVYAHFVFRGDGRTISVFVDDRPHGALPGSAADEGPFHAVGAATRRHQVFVVSDRGVPSDGDADALTRKMLEPSIEFVRAIEGR